MNWLNEILVPGTNLQRFVRFLMVGGVNTAVGYLMYAGLILLSVAAQPALAIAFSLGVLWNFWTHGRFVFGKQKFPRLLIYAFCYVGIYLFNAAGLSLALRQGLSPLLAQAIMAPVVAVLSYFVISRVLTGRFLMSD